MRAPTIGPTGEVERSYAGLLDEIKVPFRVVLGADELKIIQPDRAIGRFQSTNKQFSQGRLTGTGRTDDRQYVA